MYKNFIQQEVPKVTVKKDGSVKPVTFTHINAAYDFQVRNRSVKSLPAIFLLVLAMFNYFFSYSFKSGYESYHESVSLANPKISEINCEIPGSMVLATYSILMVLLTGSLTIAVYTLAFLYKITCLLCVVICPVTVYGCKKAYHDMPRDFAHYAGEFDFEFDSEAPPSCNHISISPESIPRTHNAMTRVEQNTTG